MLATLGVMLNTFGVMLDTLGVMLPVMLATLGVVLATLGVMLATLGVMLAVTPALPWMPVTPGACSYSHLTVPPISPVYRLCLPGRIIQTTTK